MDPILSHLFRYLAIDTKSDPHSDTVPSTPGQRKLADTIVSDLRAMGIEDITCDQNSYVFATLPATTEKPLPVIGFIAHLDTAPDMDGKCEHPQVIQYQGGDIRLNDRYSLTEEDFPFLKELIGQTLVTTDGTTLLGSDDKTGIVAIMTAMQYLRNHPEIPHGKVRMAFTPDEEIGRGPHHFDVSAFGADFAYTVDGGALAGLEYENFNAAEATFTLHGKNVHPGSAKNVMVNALHIACEIEMMLPPQERPEFTKNYEGFFMLDEIRGSVEEARATYLIRDHDRQIFEHKKEVLQGIAEYLNLKYPGAVELAMQDSYYNMKERIEPHMEIVELARQAMTEVGLQANIQPIRGGSDGSQLSYMGLPCPNLFTGGYNFHGRYELLSLDQMKKAIEVIQQIVINAAK